MDGELGSWINNLISIQTIVWAAREEDKLGNEHVSISMCICCLDNTAYAEQLPRLAVMSHEHTSCLTDRPIHLGSLRKVNLGKF